MRVRSGLFGRAKSGFVAWSIVRPSCYGQLTMKEFAGYQQHTIIGASLQLTLTMISLEELMTRAVGELL